MSDVTETGVETVQTDPAEMQDLMAGYNARSGNTLPAEVPQTQSAQPESSPANYVPNEAPPEGEQPKPAEQQKDAAQLLEERLAAFKEEVRTIANGDPVAVRKLHGEIGDINRKLKQLEPKPAPQPAPVDEELAAAMQGAERVAEDFEELGGPLVTALKAVVANTGRRASEQSTITTEQLNEQVQVEAKRLQDAAEKRQYDEAVIVLKTDHPDFATVKDSPEFFAWVKAKPAELQEVIFHTENPVLAARYLTEFKDVQRVQQKKQDRLSSAITPTGVPAPTTAQSKMTADEEVMLGYQKHASKNGFRALNKR
jgi:hypothetical protein